MKEIQTRIDTAYYAMQPRDVAIDGFPTTQLLYPLQLPWL